MIKRVLAEIFIRLIKALNADEIATLPSSSTKKCSWNYSSFISYLTYFPSAENSTVIKRIIFNAQNICFLQDHLCAWFKSLNCRLKRKNAGTWRQFTFFTIVFYTFMKTSCEQNSRDNCQIAIQQWSQTALENYW